MDVHESFTNIKCKILSTALYVYLVQVQQPFGQIISKSETIFIYLFCIKI